MSPAVSAPRGISIIVPTAYFTLRFLSANTWAATARTTRSWWSSSFLMPTSGIITSGCAAMPSSATSQAASKMARACISVISG